MSTYLRRMMAAALAAGILGVTACDDGTDPVATATVEVLAYVDANNSNSYDTGDEPVEGATVTLSMVGSTASDLTQTTGGDGVAIFSAVEIGSYTASIEPPASLTGAALASASTPTVVVDQDGATVSASFRYTYNPGVIMGHVFIGSAYGMDVPAVPGVAVTVSQGGTERTSTETDATGAFIADGLLPGDYDVTIDVPPFLAGTASQTVTLAAEDTATAEFGLEIGTTVSVADARAAAEGDTVAIIGTAITGTAGDSAVFSSSSFYMQDESGISIYLAGVDLDVMLGDSVVIYGERGSFNQEVQLSTLSAIVLGEGTLPTPETATAYDLNVGQFQGQLVSMQDFMVDSIDGGNVWGSEYTTGEDVLFYLDSTTGLDSTNFAVGTVYDVTGVAARYNETLELKPRMTADILEETSLPFSVAQARVEPANTEVTVTGVVSSGTQDPGSLATTSFYIQDATGGISVYMGSSAPADLTLGDVVEVTGTMGDFNGNIQISGSSATEVRQASAPEPRPITAAEFNAGDYQGELAVVAEATVDSVSGSNIYVSDEVGGGILVYLDGDSGLGAASFTVGETYGITGIVSTFYDYQLMPRMPEDVSGATAVDTLATITEARAAAAGTPVELTGVVTVTNDSAGSNIDDQSAWIQDGTAGILIRLPSPDSIVAVGDSITVIGTTGAYLDELQVNVDQLIRLGTGTVPTPRSVTTADIENGDYQGELAVLDSVEVTAIGTNGNITVQDASGTSTVYIDSTTDIDASTTFTVGSSYQIIGVLSRYYDTFELKPRSSADISSL
ncbi:MAG: DUF5689 domain-containing protein [Candidatus Longimicrobiales bacterium M2_2A_002]